MTASINAANFLMLSTFGIAAVGYLLGRITIKGISLGTAGVFVIALVYGAFFGTRFNSRFVIEEINYASQALKIIENLGLVFFVTSVGFIAGPNFFKNMKHNFKSYVLLGVVIILSGGLTAILCLLVGRAIESGQPGYDPGQLTAMISGLLAGSLTSTPAFSATKEAVAAQYQDAVTVGYGIAYLFGVIGVVLFVQLMPRVVHADLDEERRKITHVETGDVAKFKGKLLEFDDFGFTPFAVAAVFGILLGSVKFFNFFSLTTTATLKAVVIRILFSIQHKWSVCFDICLVNHHKSIAVAHFIEKWCIWIMAGTNGIEVVLLHQGKVCLDLLHANCKSGDRIGVMAVHTTKLDLLSI